MCILLTLSAHAQEGYSSCPVCLSVCPFSLFCVLGLLGVQREESAATAWKMQEKEKAIFFKTA